MLEELGVVQISLILLKRFRIGPDVRFAKVLDVGITILVQLQEPFMQILEKRSPLFIPISLVRRSFVQPTLKSGNDILFRLILF